MHPFDIETSQTLLREMRDRRNDQAWSLFFEKYKAASLSRCRSAGLGHDEAEDLFQKLALKLIERMETFIYDPSKGFRKWLCTILDHMIIDTRRAHMMESLPSDAIANMADGFFEISNLDELEDPLEHALKEAKVIQERVKSRFGSKSWQIFWETDINGGNLPEIAKQLHMTYSAAYEARARIRRALKKEAAIAANLRFRSE